MKLLDDILSKFDSAKDHVGSALERLISSEVSYDASKAPVAPAAAAPAPAAKAPKYKASDLVAALAYNETRGVEGDPYKFRQPSGTPEYGDAMGRYQTTGGELETWSTEFMGHPITPEQYAADPKLQDAYTTAKVQKLLDIGATPEEIFAMHRGGLTHFMDPEARKRRVADRKGYVTEAMKYLSTLGG
jgi:hypothetical protein